jgi:hypothetical protein
MSILKFSSILIMLLVFASLFLVPMAVAETSKDQAASALANADEAVSSAYQAVSKAEESGANVSSLLVRLNVAGEYLANADIQYRLGKFENATRFANLCYSVGEEVKNEAVDSKNQAYSLGVTDLVVKMTVSMLGVVVIVFLSFFVWGAFKRRYQKRVLGMKPEVVSGES